MLGVAALALLASGCSSTTGGATGTPAPAATSASAASPDSTITAEYLPALPATMRLPKASGPAPLVVLVPGGGWTSADPTGLVPLAQELTTSGATTATITYGTTSTGATYPQPPDDVACAVRWAAAQAAKAGHPPSGVVVLGHSAGGHLASLVALSGDRFAAGCADPPVQIDGLVGLAGVYSIRQAADAVAPLFGSTPDQDPQSWNEGDPTWWVTQSPPARLPKVLLLHGDADDVVPMSQTDDFATALRGAGADVTVDVVPGADHQTIYQAAVASGLVETWLAELSSSG